MELGLLINPVDYDLSAARIGRTGVGSTVPSGVSHIGPGSDNV